jgi:PTS system mannose-specific IID component
MVPIIRRLYDTKEEVIAALKRHLVFFNTATRVGSLIHGMVIAMEEERASGADISDETINGLKTALMGPLAGIGDALTQGLVRPLLAALGIAWAVEGNFFGPIFFVLSFTLYVWGTHYFFWFAGYRWGREAVERLLAGGLMKRITVLASVVGLTVAGVMVTRFVRVTMPITLTAGDAVVNVGTDFLDRIVPGILPLAVTLVCWRLLRRRIPAIYIVAGIFVVGFVGGALGLLGR